MTNFITVQEGKQTFRVYVPNIESYVLLEEATEFCIVVRCISGMTYTERYTDRSAAVQRLAFLDLHPFNVV